MFDNIIKTCDNFNKALSKVKQYPDQISIEDNMILQYFNIDLAKSIIEDIDDHNAKQIAKIILAYIE